MREITQEIKEKIFGLYYGQPIERDKMANPNWAGYAGKNEITVHSYLDVIPLDKITDGDAIDVAKLFGGSLASTGRGICESIISNGVAGQRSVEFIYAIDYLRDKGYATPCKGYTVDELVTAGIFKLTPTTGLGR